MLIDVERFSTWKRFSAVVTRFFYAFQKVNFRIVDTRIKAEEFRSKMSQSSTFRDEISAISNSKVIPKNSHIVHSSPYLDNHGTLRAEGRLGRFNVEGFSPHPIILNSVVTRVPSFTDSA